MSEELVGEEFRWKGDDTLNLLVARTATERIKGLSGMNSLPGDVRGMLFDYDQETFVPFVAKECGFDLAIGFYDSQGTFLGSAEIPQGSVHPVWPPAKFRYAVEVPVEDIDSLGSIEL